MVGVLALVPACFVGGMLWGPWLIQRLRDLRFGKQIRLEGLAAGTAGFAFLAYLVIALRHGDLSLAAACAATIGALLAYLWFNVHPARVFMGGVGSLAIGAGLATVALLSGEVLLLPVVGLPLVVVLLSVILQVGYFKMTGGRRIFRRAPIHHHWD